jgi:hypothetical protein
MAQDPGIRAVRQYLENREYQQAVDGLTTILSRPNLTAEMRKQILKLRGFAHYQTGRASGIKAAILDKQEAGEPGLNCGIRASTADLRVGDKTVGTLTATDQVMVTSVSSLAGLDYLWVVARGEVQLPQDKQGWIPLSAVLEPPKPAPVVVAPAQADLAGQATQMRQFPAPQTRSVPRQYNENPMDEYYRDFIRRKGRLPKAGETPAWENAEERQRLRAKGLLK